MNSMINQLLEANIVLIIGGLIYAAFLSRDFNFQARRFYVLLVLISVFLVPWIDLSVFVAQDLNAMGKFASLTLPELVFGEPVVSANTTISFAWWWIPLFIYSAVVIVMVIRFAAQYLVINRILSDKSIERKNLADYTLLETSGNYPTFSFFNYLVLNKDNLSQNESEQIIAHELVHIRQKHSWDMMLLELITILFWYNPVSWYFKKAQIENHEYLADNIACQGSDAESYQGLLVRMTMIQMGAVGHYFSNIETLKRINMMNVKTKKSNKWKWGIVLTVSLLVMTIMACNDDLVTMVDSAQMVADIPDGVQDEMSRLSAEYPGVKFVYTEFDVPADKAFDMEKLGLNPETIQFIKPFEERGKIGVVMTANEDFQKMVEYRKSADGIFDLVEDQPMPIGGMKTFYRFIGENMNYPLEAREAGIEGRVFVQFVIGKDGVLRDVAVVKGIGKACDEEAIRVVRSSAKWKPGMQRGEAVNVRMILPITFSLGNNDGVKNDVIPPAGKTVKKMEEMVVVGHSE